MENTIKWNRKDGKALEFKVEDTVKFYADGNYMGEIFHVYPLQKENDGIVEFENVNDKYQTYKLKITNIEIREAILQAKIDNMKAIDNFFENIEKAELSELSNGSIVLNNTGGVKLLDTSYFNEKLQKWIQENKKYFVKHNDLEEIDDMMYDNITYTFNKNNTASIDEEIEDIKSTKEYKERQDKIKQNEKKYFELNELANSLTDDDFEDVTGLARGDYV